MNRPCHLSLLGRLNLQIGGRTVDRFRTHKTGALLAYLACFRDRRHLREALADMFWPDSSSEEARLSLRVALASLRRILEPPGVLPGSVLIADRMSVQLNAEFCDTDVSRFEACIETAVRATATEARIDALIAAISVYAGELLPGHYEEWVGPERNRLDTHYVEALRRLSHTLSETNDVEQAIEFARRAVAAAPLDEQLRLRLMKLLLRVDRPVEALRQYADLERVLQSECGVTPFMELQRLAASISTSIRELKAGADPKEQDRSASPAAASNAKAAILPITLTRFFGRSQELAHITELLRPETPAKTGIVRWGDSGETVRGQSDGSTARLVTLIGHGGVGKTRLSIEAARLSLDAFRQAVYFVPLADIDDPARVPEAIAQALKLPRVAEADPTEQVVHALDGRPTLLILDNVEQLLEENARPHVEGDGEVTDVRSVVKSLLQQIGSLAILVTSRQALAIAGERQVAVHPLPVPEVGAKQEDVPKSGGDVSDLESHQSACATVQLFVDRARLVRSDFRLTHRSRAAVSELCAKLEGLPLSIELAAAWSQILSPAQILARLEQREELLVNRTKDCPPRHFSLRSTMEWSYDLLPEPLQRFFACLSVFRNGWTLEMAETICEEPRALEYLAELHSRSMILAEADDDAVRYRMLDTIRAHAGSRLDTASSARLSKRHAIEMLRLAEMADAGLVGLEQTEWLRRLDREHDNMRAALRSCLRSEESTVNRQPARNLRNRKSYAPSDAEIGMRLAGALRVFWSIRSHVVEGRHWLQSALGAAGEGADDLSRARALFADGELAFVQGDDAAARARAETCLSLYCGLVHEQGMADSLLLLSKRAHRQGEIETADQFLDECLTLSRRIGYTFGLASALREAGRRKGFLGDYAAADFLFIESRGLSESIGDLRGTVATCYEQAIIEGYRQDFEAAMALYDQASRRYRELGDRPGMSWVAFGKGYIARMDGDLDSAEQSLQEHLLVQRQLVSKTGIGVALRNLGCVARDRGDYARASALLEEALCVFQAIGERHGAAETLGSMGVVAMYRGAYAAARQYHELCLDFRRESGFRQDISESLYFLTFVAAAEGDLTRGKALAEECIEYACGVGSRITASGCFLALAEICLGKGDYRGSEAALRTYLHRIGPTPEPWAIARGAEAAALLRAAHGHDEDATRLFGAATQLTDPRKNRKFPYQQRRYDLSVAGVRRRLGASSFTSAWNQGAALTLQQVRDFASDAIEWAVVQGDADREG